MTLRQGSLVRKSDTIQSGLQIHPFYTELTPPHYILEESNFNFSMSGYEIYILLEKND